MPRYILKVAPDRDLYVNWSTIVDAPLWIGTRAEALTELPGEATEDRLARADAYGTSAHDRSYGFADKGMIYEQQGWLPRERLALMADLFICEGLNADVKAAGLLDPFDDD